jgi:hypothetical protein
MQSFLIIVFLSIVISISSISSAKEKPSGKKIPKEISAIGSEKTGGYYGKNLCCL